MAGFPAPARDDKSPDMDFSPLESAAKFPPVGNSGAHARSSRFFGRCRLLAGCRILSAKFVLESFCGIHRVDEVKLLIPFVMAAAVGTAMALEPTPRPDPRRFAGEVAAFEREAPDRGGIVFTGSSSIRLWTTLKEDFAGLPVINRGFGGSTANDLTFNFESLIARHEPKLLVTYTGGNDLNFMLSVDEAFDDYVKFLDLTHKRFSGIRIILTSVKIAPNRAGQVPQVRELNQRLQAWAADRKWVRYVDSTSYLADESGMPRPEYFVADLIHLNAEGYARWREILEPVVREEWEKVK